MFRRGYDLRELTIAACRAAGFEPVFTVEGGEMDAVLGFVRAGLGAGRRAPHGRRPLRACASPRFAGPGLHRTISVAHRSDVSPPRAARELQRIIERSVQA